MSVVLSELAKEYLEKYFNESEARNSFVAAAQQLTAFPDSGKLVNPESTVREFRYNDVRILYDVAKKKLINEPDTILILSVFRTTGGSVIPGPSDDLLVQWANGCLRVWETRIQELPPEHPARFQYGRYSFTYLVGAQIRQVTPKELIDVLRESTVRHTGWPPWWVPTRKEIAPRVVDNEVECWFGRGGQFQDAAHSDFWRASPRGLLFLLRGYQEDGPEISHTQAGSVFDVTLPIWRAGEALLHAARFAGRVATGKNRIVFRAEWNGLRGRRLASIANQRNPVEGNFLCRQNRVTAEVDTTGAEIDEFLPSVVYSLVTGLYREFNDFELSSATVSDELAVMRANKF